MGKQVGLSRAIKLEWLDKTVEYVIEGKTSEEIKESLNKLISYDIKSPDNIRKTRDILMNIWVRPFENEAANRIRQNALSAISNGSDDKSVMHWCMLLLYYPVFIDTCETIGKISTMQDSFSLAWLKSKMFEEWGERTTLLHSLDKIMQTIRQMGFICSQGGVYSINKKAISGDETKSIIVKTLLALQLKAYYEPSELSTVPQMFPFEYSIDSELIFGSGDFILGNFGGNPVVTGFIEEK